MIRSGLVNTQNGYTKGYRSNYSSLARYEHVISPHVSGPDLPLDYKTVTDPLDDSNTLKRPSDTFYNAVFKKQATDPVRQVADILLRRLTQNVPGRPLTPSVPGIQPFMGGGGPGAGGPRGGGGGGGFGAGPVQGPAPDTEAMAAAAEARAAAGEAGVPTPVSGGPLRLRGAGQFSPELVSTIENANARLPSGGWRTVFETTGSAISKGVQIARGVDTVGRVVTSVLPRTPMIKTALLQVLPKEMAGPILQFSRDLEDMSQRVGRLAEDYVVVPASRAAANVVGGGARSMYNIASKVAGLAQSTKIVEDTVQGPVALDTAISQGDIPVDQVEKIINEVFGGSGLNEEAMEAYIQKNIETARQAMSINELQAAHEAGFVNTAVLSSIGNITKMMVSIIALVAFASFQPQEAARLAGRVARGGPGSSLRPIALLKPVQRYGFQ